jgi:hypothetical protein
MCEAGRLVADFVAGTCDKPAVPELADSLTTTVDGAWVVWAYKLARQQGDGFAPMSGIGSYFADAQAECTARRSRTITVATAATGWPLPPPPHPAPDPSCTCGFYALSDALAQFARRLALPGLGWLDAPLVDLTVVLSGRVLAFEWADGGLLFRAARQNVVRVDRWPDPYETEKALLHDRGVPREGLRRLLEANGVPVPRPLG